MTDPARRSALLTVFFVVLIDLIGFGIVLPYLAFYGADFQASPLWIGLLYSAYSAAQLISSPFWGSLSDRVGRRPIMLVSTLGAAGAYVLFSLAGSFWVLLASRIFAGAMAGNISTAQAYVADVTDEKDRARGMGMIGAAFGAGFVLGPALGAMLSAWPVSLPAPFDTRYAALGLSAALLSITSFLLVAFKLPETVRPGSLKADGTRVSRPSVFSAAFWKAIGLGTSSTLPLLMLGMFLLSFGQSSLYGAFPLFCKDRLFLSNAQVGIFYVWMGGVAIIIQGGMIRPLVRRVGEKPLFVAGALLLALGLFLLPWATGGTMLAVFLFLMTAGASLAGPTLTSLVSKESDPARYGATLGASQGLSALGRAIGPSWGGALYAYSYKMPFVATSVIMGGLLWTALSLMRAKRTP